MSFVVLNGMNNFTAHHCMRVGLILPNALRTTDFSHTLFNWRNSAELIGKTSVFKQQPEPHIFASSILRIRCDESNTYNYFLKHLLNHYREQEVFVKLSRRAVNQANYNRNEILELRIPFPKYDEQCEIAKTIGAVESKIHRHERKKGLLEELFHTLLHQLMTGQTRMNKIDMPGLA